MISQTELYNKLTEIAKSHNLEGESIEVQKDWLSYLFSSYGLEVLNAIKESNLATASLMNSRITQCMQCMYSVYRGHNVKLRMVDYVSNTIWKKNKYDLLYKSNNFYVYANEPLDIVPTSEGQVPVTFDCIISRKPKYTNTIQITETNKYYVDFQIRDRILSNLSEDILVKIGAPGESPQEVKTTRLFYDHINQPTQVLQQELVELLESNQLSKIDSESKLFVLTIPDYGIRIYKKGYFKPNTEVTFECFDYCTKDDLLDNFESEVNRIKFNGFDMVVTGNATDTKLNRLISEVPRDTIDSTLYNAVAYQHIQSQMMTNSDIDTLFTEYFRDYVYSSKHLSVPYQENGTTKWKVVIYYIPIDSTMILEQDIIDEFARQYAGYYISDEIIALAALKYELPVTIRVRLKNSVEILSDIETIFRPYHKTLPELNSCDPNGSLSDPSSVTSIINHDLVKAQITQLPSVQYITEFSMDDVNHLRYLITENGVNMYYPTYFEFKYNISTELI